MRLVKCNKIHIYTTHVMFSV